MLHGKIESIKSDKEISELVQSGAFILDVRTRLETWMGMVKGAVSIPLLRVQKNLDKLPKDKTIIVYCASGGRADMARKTLEKNGFKAANGGGYKNLVKLLGGK